MLTPGHLIGETTEENLTRRGTPEISTDSATAGAEPGEVLPGHYISGVLMLYSHRCPGEGCQIYQWLNRQALRQARLKYAALTPEPESESCE